MQFPPAGFQLPPYVSAELGDFGSRKAIASRYFSTVHLWMPIVSKRRVLERLSSPFTSLPADMALLALSMKLAVWSPSPASSNPCNATYLTARQYMHSVESSSRLTLPGLQAALLIALYEIGHAIYPAAHFSVRACANYAITMGLGWKTLSWHRHEMSWVETEERRRVWWAVVILERCVPHTCYIATMKQLCICELNVEIGTWL